MPLSGIGNGYDHFIIDMLEINAFIRYKRYAKFYEASDSEHVFPSHTLECTETIAI